MDLVHGYVGMRVCPQSLVFVTIRSDCFGQDCGIRNSGTSSTSRYDTQQPESDGQAGLRSRGVCGRFGNSSPFVASITSKRSPADWNMRIARTGKLSHVSRDLLRAATSAVDHGAATEVAMVELLRPAAVAAVVRFTFPTFVVPILSASGLNETVC